MKTLSLKVTSIGETTKLAHKLAQNLKGGEVICLIGELGVGKTYFIKFLAEALGVSGADVISPTFVYWRKHKGDKFKINHFDFYRIGDESEVEEIGFEDALSDKKAVTVIEWADNVQSYLPEDRLEIHIKYLGERERQLKLSTLGDKLDYLLDNLEPTG